MNVAVLPTALVVSRKTGLVVTSWGRMCVEKNPENCVSEWREGRSGVTWFQTLCAIS